MIGNNNQLNESQPASIPISESECTILLGVVEMFVAEVNSLLAQQAEESKLQRRITRNGRDIARLKAKIGLLSPADLSRELNRIDSEEQSFLESIRDRALIKGLLLKICEKLSQSLEIWEQKHAA